jgi:hypothetical protein
MTVQSFKGRRILLITEGEDVQTTRGDLAFALKTLEEALDEVSEGPEYQKIVGKYRRSISTLQRLANALKG